MATGLPVKVVVTFERREDGGLRVYSDDVPGFVLSHSDPMTVLGDVKPALERILSHMHGVPIGSDNLPKLFLPSANTRRSLRK